MSWLELIQELAQRLFPHSSCCTSLAHFGLIHSQSLLLRWQKSDPEQHN